MMYLFLWYMICSRIPLRNHLVNRKLYRKSTDVDELYESVHKYPILTLMSIVFTSWKIWRSILAFFYKEIKPFFWNPNQFLLYILQNVENATNAVLFLVFSIWAAWFTCQSKILDCSEGFDSTQRWFINIVIDWMHEY